MKKDDLLNLINDDDLGLLSIKSKNASAFTAEERLVTSFLEINNFIQENKREPELGSGLQEHQLASRLKSLREEKEKMRLLLDFDEYDLLSQENKEVKSIDDIFNDDDFGIFNNVDEGLFNLKNVSKNFHRESADFIARRKPCKDFEKYESIFIECQSDLLNGKRKILKFTKDSQIKEKTFFVLNGILLFLDELGEKYINKYGRWDSKQRCIFENGTESEMLLRSLARSLYKEGYLVSEKIETDALGYNVMMNENDIKTGYIYIIKSLSENPKINSLENLYKIGFSSIPVEERIKNAKEDPTFLMSSVRIIETFECYNFNPQKMELMLHNFFGAACLNIDIFDQNNKRYVPREWFIAPLNIIENTIQLIINGGIVNYKYDTQKQEIVLR